MANSASSLAKAIKLSFLATKSVSQLRETITPVELFELTFAIAAPSEDSLSALLAATF